jgi:hypothetical protein
MIGNNQAARAGHRSVLAVAALELAAKGHPLIPLHTPGLAGGCSCGSRCGRQGKHPRGLLGLRSASADLEQVEAWWWGQPSANIGLRCDGLLAFDVDGPNGRRALERLQDELGELPPTRSQLTGRGSQSLYSIPADARISNSTARLGNPLELDLRAGTSDNRRRSNPSPASRPSPGSPRAPTAARPCEPSSPSSPGSSRAGATTR